MKGQYTNTEFEQMLQNSKMMSGRNYDNGTAWIIKGNTTNYYMQHEDGSWTNYDCKTKY